MRQHMFVSLCGINLVQFYLMTKLAGWEGASILHSVDCNLALDGRCRLSRPASHPAAALWHLLGRMMREE